MRDWDNNKKYKGIFLILLGLHYLWGIETYININNWCNRFYKWDYITYEGLRLFFLLFIYESYLHWFTGLHYLWGIETKSQSEQITTSIFGITLPMRDWDIWRLHCFYQCNCLGLHYLWGIETFLLFTMILHVSIMDYITYEGLRLFCPCFNSSFLFLGLHYLWGIET